MMTSSATVRQPQLEPPKLESIEKTPSRALLEQPSLPPALAVDIERLPVEDDPREWSDAWKNATLFCISFASMSPTFSASIYTPAINIIQSDLYGTSDDISLSLALFILLQGATPIIWSALSEVKGRKIVYLISLTLFTVGTVVASRAMNMGVLIGMRCLGAIGSSAVLSIGAGTLADIYDTKERGTRMGIYYAFPLLGPAFGPLLGGLLTQVFTWRATFYFLASMGGCAAVSFLFFKDTFRRERSAAYIAARKRAVAHAVFKAEKGGQAADFKAEDVQVRLTLADVNPLAPAGQILKMPHNLCTLFFTGMIFASQYSLSITAARTFAFAPYNYDTLIVGAIILAFGVGSVVGSVFGGRRSDHVLANLKAKNNGVHEPEFRIRSILYALPVLPASFLVYGWIAETHQHVAVCVVILFIAGAAMAATYSPMLAYVVDSNAGRSSSAVACNSLSRGLSGFVASMIAIPLQNAIGDGPLYTIWAGLISFGAIAMLFLVRFGTSWRDPEWKWRKGRNPAAGTAEA